MTQTLPMDKSTLESAYAGCEAIAKSKAKNFYYSFVALPLAKRRAMCAIYAFMRQADDIADDDALPKDLRRQQLREWQAAWRETLQGGACCNPVFLAVRDSVERFAIPLELLDILVQGVTSDVEAEGEGAPLTYATFDELYRYCYNVASVVGLVCIRIFGYTDPAAEKLAEETGVAFQLTNILRDIAEDAGRKRVYLSMDDLQAHGVSVDSLISRAPGTPPSPAERALLAHVAAKAERYYASAQALLPLIDAESRPALWVMVSIYHRLLQKIKAADYDVFSRRLSVPLVQKLGILAVGQARIARARLFE